METARNGYTWTGSGVGRPLFFRGSQFPISNFAEIVYFWNKRGGSPPPKNNRFVFVWLGVITRGQKVEKVSGIGRGWNVTMPYF